MQKSSDLPTTPVNDPTGNPFPPQPGPVPATEPVKVPVPAGQVDLLDPKVIEEEVKRGNGEIEAEYGK